MKLLSFKICDHDSNFSYFDGEQLHYHKTERTYQEKHHCIAYKNSFYIWEEEIKKVWDLAPNDLDDIAIIVSPQYWPPHPIETQDDYSLISNYEGLTRINHHYAHALSDWPIIENSDIQIVIDASGDGGETFSIFKNYELIYNQFRHDRANNDIGSLGVELNCLASELGIEKSKSEDTIINTLDLAGKLMGLQSYGNYNEEYAKKISHLKANEPFELFDNRFWVDTKKDTLIAKNTKLDWARTVHEECGKKLVDFFRQYASEDDVIYYSGGVAQNVLWNTELKKVFKNLHVAPHCGDDGLSLGGIEFLRRKHNLPKFKFDKFPYRQSDEYADPAVDQLIEDAAKLLAQGKIVAWYQENGEIGPRALGNRSILLDPRITNGRDVINRLKKREAYRPFGASVLKDCKDDIFEDLPDNPYMLYVSKLKTPGAYPSIEHVDKTCRAQTVDESNGTFYKLLKKFHELTGCPVLLNTSFNLAGKPIVGSKADAVWYFDNTDLDCLVVGNEMRTRNV